MAFSEHKSDDETSQLVTSGKIYVKCMWVPFSIACFEFILQFKAIKCVNSPKPNHFVEWIETIGENLRKMPSNFSVCEKFPKDITNAHLVSEKAKHQ